MRKPHIAVEPMGMAGRRARPWCSRDGVIGLDSRGTHAYAVQAGFGVTQLPVPNGIVRLEGLGGGTG